MDGTTHAATILDKSSILYRFVSEQQQSSFGCSLT